MTLGLTTIEWLWVAVIIVTIQVVLPLTSGRGMRKKKEAPETGENAQGPES